MQTPGQFLKAARLAMGWSMPDVAFATGISKSRLGWIETGRRKRISLAESAKLCDHYRVSLLVLAALADEHMGMEGAG
jgi:transcriptional regulator with XRE-family HTH domain